MTDRNHLPDFSGDDFANDKDILAQRAAIKAYEKMIEDSLALIARELKMNTASHTNFKGFHMFKNLSAIITKSMKSIGQTYEIRASLAEYTSSYPVPRNPNTGTDLYLFGHMTLKKSYPRTYIHKETIKEKIEDLFLKRDLDFPQSKKFSRKFQVMTADKEALHQLLQFKNFDPLTAFPDMELELSGNTALFRNSRRALSLEESTDFCELSKALLTIFN
ncbi:MAG: hypothetical protein KA821_14210 [Chitinophagaceae bacterium]|nr:hypothetical protein [Chitinophagaceae bacterium]